MENYGVDFIARCIAGEALDKASSGSGITVDSELSTTSTNPVQNKVITNAFNNVHIDVDAALSTTSENPVQNKVITEEVNSKPTCVNTSGTKVYGQKIVQLTKAQYDAIASKDANTYYMITDDASDEQYTAGDGIDITNGVISLDVQYGASLEMTINPNTYVLTATLKDQDGSTLGTAQTIDLPLETMVVGGSYDDTTKKVVLTLQNGTTIEFSVADLVSGLESSAHAASTYQTIAGMSNYATQTDIADMATETWVINQAFETSAHAASTYQTVAAMSNYVTQSDISDMATETWVGQQGFLTSANEVPAVGSSDDGKVLTASYSGGTGSYSWETASSGTTDYTQLSNKPSINGVTLTGNQTTSGLGINEVSDSVAADLGKVLTCAGADTYGWANLPYATSAVRGTVRVWTTVESGETVLNIATEDPT